MLVRKLSSQPYRGRARVLRITQKLDDRGCLFHGIDKISAARGFAEGDTDGHQGNLSGD